MKADAPASARITHSLHFRIALGVMLILAAGAVAVSVAAFAYGRQAAQQSFDRLLIGAANQIAGSISLRGAEVVVDIPVSAFELLSLAPRDRVVYGVYGEDGALITGYDGLARPEGDARFYNGSFAGDPARFVRVTRQFAERSFQGQIEVIIGQTLTARRGLAQEITQNALVAVVAFGLIMTALTVVAVQSALRPLRRIEQDFAARSSRDLTPVEADVPPEIRSLVAVLNRFIGRIDRQLKVMQTLIADASHQLRTPIAALRAQAELASEEPDPARQQMLNARILERARNLSRLTDQLLSHALIIHRADTVDLQQIDLRKVATDAVAQTDQSHADHADALRLDLPESEVICTGDALSLVEACKNMINNALSHGVAPITVFVDMDAGTTRLGVRDQGPGLDEAHWADAGTRFSKNAGVSAKSAGLGLAIVDEVARAHGGHLGFTHLTPKGFAVFIALEGRAS